MFKKLKGFTLSEILIALSVIGVVSALVLPNLIAGNKAATAKAQFSTAYSLLAKSIADMDADNISIRASSYATNTFFDVYKHYQKYTIDCGTLSDSSNTSVCPKRNSATSYKQLVGNGSFPITDMDDGAIVINNGMLIAFDNCVGCNHGADHNIWMLVDINGYGKNPNRLGYDLFIFQLTNNGEVLPLGAPGTDIKFSETTDPKNNCCVGKVNSGCSAGSNNGYTCAFFAATQDDYFSKLYKGH